MKNLQGILQTKIALTANKLRAVVTAWPLIAIPRDYRENKLGKRNNLSFFLIPVDTHFTHLSLITT